MVARVLTALCVLALLGLAPAAPASEFEDRPELTASELLPPELLKGPHHRVEEQVEIDGYVPVYTVRTDEGRIRVRGREALREKIREIEALAALEESRQTASFEAAAARAGESPPPSGGARGRPVAVPGLAVGTLPERPAKPAGEAPKPALGYEAMKRKIADALGIDPYTENEELQRELDQHAWAAYAGGMSSLVLPETDEAQAEEAEDEGSDRAAELLREWSTEDLTRLNRIELAAMGVEEPLREEFLDHPSYSPRTGTVLVDALAELEGTEDRAAFIEAAVNAKSTEEAQSYRRIAELIRGYGESGGSLQKIAMVDGRVAAYAADGTLVVPVIADHAFWTQRLATFAESMARAAGTDPSVAKTRFLVSGQVSKRARQGIEELGIEVREEGAQRGAPR